MMLSFSKVVKQEIMDKQFNDDSQVAIFLALIKLLGVIEQHPLSLVIESSDHSVINFISRLIQNIYNLSLKVKQLTRVNFQRQIVIYHLELTDHFDVIFDRKMLSYNYQQQNLIINNDFILKNEMTKRAFIAGAFIATGSVNSPSISNYHCEIQSSDLELIKFLQKLINSFGFKFKRIYRRKKPLIYLKKSTEISDFLKLIDASIAVLNFENERISRDMFNSLNRLTNIEVSNQLKTNIAAKKQILMIEFLKKHHYFQKLNLKTQQVAMLRIENEEASLNELCDLFYEKYKLYISKSGINHIMREIKEYYLVVSEIINNK